MKSFKNLYLVLVINFSVVFGTYVDLTHSLTNTGMSKLPWHTSFNLTLQRSGPTVNNSWSWLAFGELAVGEHIGTHLDAPYHFYETGDKIADIPLQKLHGPGVVIDVKSKVAQNKDYTVKVADLEAWESTNGRIPDNAIIIMFSDFGKHFGNDREYLGAEDISDPQNRHWPSFSKESVQWLIDNRPTFLGLAVDSLACDAGQPDGDFPVHTTLLPSGRVCLENTANVDQLPATGSHVFIMPIKIKEGTGAATRSFAAWDEDWLNVSAASYLSSRWTTILTSIILFFTMMH